MVELMAQAASRPAQPGFFETLGVPLLFGVLVFWFLFFRPKNAEQKKFQTMLAALKKGDRVQTIGGILGIVVSVSDNEVTLKVDESTNTKMTFVKSAIARVTTGGEPGKS